MECKRKVLCNGKRTLGSHNSFNNRVICKVQKHNNPVHNICFLEGVAEVHSDVVLNAHSGKNYRKIVAVGNCSLTDKLNGKLIVLHTRARENRKLLTSDKSCKSID